MFVRQVLRIEDAMRQSLGIFAAMILMACGLYAVISPAFAETCCPEGCAPEANRCVTTSPLWTRCIPIACAEGSRRPSAGSSGTTDEHRKSAVLARPLRAAHAGQTEYDPAKVSDSLKAVFQFGSVSTQKALNASTVTLLSGTIGGTYVQFGADLASVLDDDGKLRVLSITGRGSVQSVADVLFLKGVDLGIVRADTLDYLEKKGFANDIKKRFTYVTKLYNEEMQIIAPKTVKTLNDLEGKTVSVDLPDGGTFVTALTVFERLGLKANFVYIEQRIAMEKLKKGELDAVIVVGGKPYASVRNFNNDGRFHLAAVDYSKPLQSDYLPATLTSKDYPNLIPEGETVDTIAVPSVLAAYNWPPNTERSRKLAVFVDAFFTKFPALQNPPFHPKWKEVSLTAPLAGWNRLPLAQQWLDKHGVGPVKRQRFEAALQDNQAGVKIESEAYKEALFRQFQAWAARGEAYEVEQFAH
jgi:TRAP transporter TAXI family solute receptor